MMILGLSGLLALFFILDIFTALVLIYVLFKITIPFLTGSIGFRTTETVLIGLVTLIAIVIVGWILFKRITAFVAKTRSPNTPTMVVKTLCTEWLVIAITSIFFYFLISSFTRGFGVGPSGFLVTLLELAFTAILVVLWIYYFQTSQNVLKVFGANADPSPKNLLKVSKEHIAL